jgi:FkbM family methyltransferase
MIYPSASLSCQIPGLNTFYQYYFDGKSDGVFVEVGANDGKEWSNTWHLANSGWRGLYFEPVKALVDKCKEIHQKNNVAVINAAVGAEWGETKLYTGEGATTSAKVAQDNTFFYGNSPDKFTACPVVTLNKSLKENNIPVDFDLLVIDVDGDETGVLAGLDLNIWKPYMVIIETSKNPPIEAWRFNAEPIDNILSPYYDEIYCDHINSIYIRKDEVSAVTSLFESKKETILKIAGWYECVNLVETGTGNGDMLQQLYPYFTECHSVELSQELYQNARRKFSRIGNVRIYNDDSGDFLKNHPLDLKGNTFYFLDAHFCGGYSAYGSKSTPIMEEIQTLLSGKTFNSIILIDDLKLFTGTDDYPTPAHFEEFVKGLRKDVTFEIIADGGGMILITPSKRKRKLNNKLVQLTPVYILEDIPQQVQEEQPREEPRTAARAPILYGPYR